MTTNFLTACEQAINKAAGKELTNEEMLSIVQNMEDTIARIRNENQAISMEEAALKAADELSNGDKLAKAIEARNKIINERIFLELTDYIKNSFSDRPDIGIASILDNRNEARVGARDSVFIEQKALQSKYTNGYLGELDSLGLTKIYASGVLEREITIALDALSRHVETKGMNNQAVEIAKVISKWQEIARLDANKAGAWIGSLDGYVTRQTHDVFKIRADTFEDWRDMVLPILDHKATFGGQKNINQMLRWIYDDIVTGNYLRNDKPDWMSGFKGTSNIAKKASQNRVLHFKDGASWFEYNAKYGAGNLRETIASTFDRMASTTGMMRKLGTNPERMLNRLSDSVVERLRGEGNTKAEIAFSDKYNRIMKTLYPEVAGLTRLPSNHMIARFSATARAIDAMTKLGGATLSSFNDIPMGALELRYQGKDLFTSLSQSIFGRFKRYKEADRKELAKLLGVYAEKMNEEIAYRFSGDISVAGKASRAMRTFFKLNLLNWWTENGRHSAAFLTSNWLAKNANHAFDNLDASLKRVLSQHNIEKAEWSLYQKMDKYTMKGNDYMVPERVYDLPESDIADYLASKDIAINERSLLNAREDLTDKLRKYILDRTIVAVSDPTPRNKAILNQGTRSGTIEGEAFRFISQFKSFTVSFMQNHLGRELFGRGYTPAALGERSINSLGNALRNGNGELLGLANLIVWTTAFGYLSMQAKEVLKGKTPRPASIKTLQAAFLQGGGLGIYGDFLFGEVNRFGNGPVVSALGPMVGNTDQVFKLWQMALNGEAKAGDAFKFVLDHTPFINIPYIRATMDYLILNRTQENLSPGSLDRQRERMLKEQGNDYIIPPSQFMLGR